MCTVILLENVWTENGNVPRLNKKLCLNYRTSSVLCRSCTATCPVQAVRLSGKLPSFDRDLCRGCGACAAACIPSALQAKHFPWKMLLERAQHNRDFTLGCSASTCSTVKLPCLGGLPSEFLAIIALLRQKRSLTLDLSPCSDCISHPSLQQLWRSLKAAKELLGAVLPVSFLFKQTAHKEPALCTRREMLQDAGKELLLLSGQLLQKYTSTTTDNTFSSPRTLLLQAALKSNNAPITLPTWKIKDTCRGCGRCRSVCPHQAWELVISKSCLELWHTPWHCRGCSLCARLCPAGAKAKDRVVLQPQEQQPHLIGSIKAKYCSRCKLRPVSFGKDNSLCPACKKKMLLEKALFNV